MRDVSGPNLGSSLRNVFKQTSSRDINEEEGMGLGGRLKGKGNSEKVRSKGQPPRFLLSLVFKWRLNARSEKCHSSNSDTGRATGLDGL